MGNDRHVSNVCRLVHKGTDLLDGEARVDIVSAMFVRGIKGVEELRD